MTRCIVCVTYQYGHVFQFVFRVEEISADTFKMVERYQPFLAQRLQGERTPGVLLQTTY